MLATSWETQDIVKTSAPFGKNGPTTDREVNPVQKSDRSEITGKDGNISRKKETCGAPRSSESEDRDRRSATGATRAVTGREPVYN